MADERVSLLRGSTEDGSRWKNARDYLARLGIEDLR